MAWKEQLDAMGFNESNAPNMIKKQIRDYNSYLKQIDKTKELLSRNTISDRKRDELEEEMEVLNDALIEQERIIESKIAQWDKNKDIYAAKAVKLKAGLEAKRGGQVPQNAQATQNVPQPPQPPAQNVVELKAEEIPNEPNEPKKSSWGWLLLVGVVAIASLGALNLSKDE